jgi:hypothetical protein
LAPKSKSLADFGKSLASAASKQGDARARRRPFDLKEPSSGENKSARLAAGFSPPPFWLRGLHVGAFRVAARRTTAGIMKKNNER